MRKKEITTTIDEMRELMVIMEELAGGVMVEGLKKQHWGIVTRIAIRFRTWYGNGNAEHYLQGIGYARVQYWVRNSMLGR